MLRQWHGGRFEEGPASVRVIAAEASIPCTAAYMVRVWANASHQHRGDRHHLAWTNCEASEAEDMRVLQVVHAPIGIGGRVAHLAERMEAAV